jgi:hypothetical protein
MVELDLRGLVLVASDVLHGIFQEISSVFVEASEEDWDAYDAVTPG